MDQEPSIVNKRIAEDKERLIDGLRATAIVELACQKAEVGRSTYYRYRQQDPEFAKKANEALQHGAELMNDMAESYLLGAIKEKNMSAIQTWLRAHHPRYSTKVLLIDPNKEVREGLTAEEQAVIEEALYLASILKKDALTRLKDIYDNKIIAPENSGDDL